MGIKLILNLFLLVSLVNCDPKVGEVYAMIDNRRLNKSQGLPALSILHCSAMCHNLGQNCCLLNFDSEILMCYWSPNCSEIRSEMGGISFKRKEKSGKYIFTLVNELIASLNNFHIRLNMILFIIYAKYEY